MPSLKRYLDAFLDSFPRESHRFNDPVQFVHRYDDLRDREVVGLIASVLSYGNVKIILKSVERALTILGPRPAEAVGSFDPKKDVHRVRGFYHRFNTSRDLAVLFWMIRRILENHGSLESAFVQGLSEGDTDTGTGIGKFSELFLASGFEQFYSRRELKERAGVRFFFPSPVHGGACKRFNLYLRWMVRPADGIDCGVWTKVHPRQLIIPLDTHIARISGYIGLTERKSPDWRMAMDITRSLRRLDREDPLRYDFALCHLGIAGDCPRKRDTMKCARCPIQAVCTL